MPYTVRIDPTANSLQADIIPDATIFNDGVMTAAQAAQLASTLPTNVGISIAVYTNITRPAPNDPIFATALAAGNVVMIWNSSEKAPEFTDGVNWYDASGNLT